MHPLQCFLEVKNTHGIPLIHDNQMLYCTYKFYIINKNKFTYLLYHYSPHHLQTTWHHQNYTYNKVICFSKDAKKPIKVYAKFE